MAKGDEMMQGPAECAELPGDFRGSKTSKNRASGLSTPQLPCKQGAGGLNTPSGGAPPAPHFAMCRSGHTEARNEFRFFLKIGMYVLRVSFGPVLYCCLLGSNWRLGGVIFWIFRPPGPVGNKTVKKTKKTQKKHHLLAPILVPFS